MAKLETGRGAIVKKRHLFLINLFFIALITFAAGVVYQFFTGNKPLESIASLRKSKPNVISTTTCTTKQPIAGLGNAASTSLRKLNLYQQACRSEATNTMMIFISMPSTAAQAKQYAAENAATLKEFGKYNIRPLVIVEPSDHEGQLLNFELFANGTYTPVIDAYFAELKALGLTDKELGIWTPFPEANLPYWNNNQAKFFAPAVTKHLQAARKYFPTIATSVLLNSATYESTDFEWQNGDYTSLTQYVKDIPDGLVTYAGLQGFPWIARDVNGGVIFNAAEFINPDLLSEMADELATKKVWFNTGTFGSKYTLDSTQTKHVTPSQRKEILMTIKDQSLLLQKKGYEVSVNIFAQDKSREAEETDWSYWQNGQPLQSPDTAVLTEFMRSLHDKNISTWLFDR